MKKLYAVSVVAFVLALSVRAQAQGVGWQQVLSGTGDVWGIATGPNGFALAATTTGVYRSTDSGATWTLIGFSPSSYGSSPSFVAINQSTGEAFVGLSNASGPLGVPGSFGGGGSGVYRSTDGGATWTYWTVGNPGAFGFDITPAGSVIAASSGPTGGNGGLFISADDGASWVYGDCCYPRAFANTSSGIFAGNTFQGTLAAPGGVFRSTDGGATWSQVGLSGVPVYSMAATVDGDVFAGSAGSGIFASTDGTTWTQVAGFTNPVTSLGVDPLGHVFAGVFGSGVFSSNNLGASWTPQNTGLTDLQVEALAVSPDPYILAGTPSGVFRQSGFGICSLYDQTKSVHSGAVFPIKFQLCDASGNDVSSSTIIVHAVKVLAVSGFSGDAETVGNANPDDDFRFDATLGTIGGYIFNLSTEGLASGTYSLQFTAGNDPFMHSLIFGVK